MQFAIIIVGAFLVAHIFTRLFWFPRVFDKGRKKGQQDRFKDWMGL